MTKILSLVLILLGLLPEIATSNGVFKIKGDLKAYLLPHKVEVQTTINDHLTLTKTKQFFKNTTDSSIELQYGFPVPIKARVIGYTWWVDSTEHRAVLVEQKQDSAAANVTGSADEAFISYTGSNPFLINIRTPLKPNSKIVVELQYIEFVDNFKGNVSYNYPMNVFLKEEFEFTLDIAVRSSWGIDTIKSEYFNGEFIIKDSSATGRVYIPKVTQGQNVSVHYTTFENRYGLSLITTKPKDEDGFYLMQIRPEPPEEGSDSLKRGILFLLDVSESMCGGKAKFAKEAISYCLRHLTVRDQFNILEFNETSSTRFKNIFSAVTPETIVDAQNYVKSRSIKGRTNITSALISALDQNYPDDTVKMIIIFTDGHDKINLSAVANKNLLKKVAIYTCATGSDAEKVVLKELAKRNFGDMQTITHANQQVGIQEFFGKIQNPLVLKPEIHTSQVNTYERFPVVQPDIYAGEQLLQLGRYENGGDADITIKGKTFSGDITYSFKGNFASERPGDSLLPKLWAKYKIEELHSLILNNPSDSNRVREWRKEIVAASLKYSIVSPYTSFKDQGKNDTLQVDTTGSGGESTGISYEPADSPADIEIYPNPSADDVFVSLKLAPDQTWQQDFSVEIYSASGELVQHLYKGKLIGERHYFYWDGIDLKGRSVPSGMYLCRITSGGINYTAKIFINR